ncbi:MAG: cob(I)yrinic acid a,c-diamide adenosyltransferase [Bacteroidales bacterium]
MKKGLIHIYTGDGKGKTTSAVGLAVRALGHQFKVCYAYFHKRPEKYGYTEIKNLEKLGAEIFPIAQGHPCCDKDIKKDEHIELTNRQFKELKEFVYSKDFDLIIMDEAVVSVRDGFLKEDALVEFMKEKPESAELVVTGRGATTEMIELADYVSEVKKIKHPYDNKITAREGIEY